MKKEMAMFAYRGMEALEARRLRLHAGLLAAFAGGVVPPTYGGRKQDQTP